MKIEGRGVSRGVHVGTARICVGRMAVRVSKDVREGDVLIADMTTPAYIPAMVKAGAFVTNKGGITCHAAIVAREFGKPCVVGAENATIRINDGARVEVDGDKGTVTVL